MTPASRCVCCGATARRVLWREGPHQAVSCAGCGLIFLDPLPRIAVAELYGREYFTTNYLAGASVRSAFFRERLEELERLKPPGTLLDVGAGVGLFLAEARRRGWRVSGVEPSAFAVHHAREALGLEVRPVALEDADLPAGGFDVVTVWDVLAHVRDPASLLRLAGAALAPGGVLAVKTPNWPPGCFALARWIGRATGRSAYFLHVPRQQYFFTETTLRLLLASAGFRVLRCEHPGEAASGSATHSDNALKNFAAVRLERLMTRCRGPLSLLVYAVKA